MISKDFMERIAFSTLNLLVQTKAMQYTSGIVFYVWERGNRIIVAFDPGAIRLDRVNDGFAHALSTRLQGRKVVRTNSRGLFLQVGLDTPKLPASLDEGIPLDLSQQPTPWHLPVGMTASGPLWIPMISGISFLIGGSTGTGKTGEEHAWIQALLHGGKTLVYAWDGKHSVEFMRYVDQANFHLMARASDIETLQAMFEERIQRLKLSGSVNIWDHNERNPNDFIPPVAVFVDEAADLPDAAKTSLQRMTSIYRFVGLYPIIATNQPTQAEMFAKVNLQTRIAFRVPHHNNSVTMLGYKGAEALPDVLGRGLISWKGKLVEFQSFRVTYPPVSDAVRELMSQQVAEEQGSGPTSAVEDPDQAQILELIGQGETDAAIVRTIWGVSGGSKFYKLIERVKALRSSENTSSSTSSTPQEPFSGLEGAL